MKLFDSKKGLPSPIAPEEEVTSKPSPTPSVTQSEARRNYLMHQEEMFKQFYTGREDSPTPDAASVDADGEE